MALVAGTGAYVFFRRVLQVSYWPAAITAWCYPLTGFFILWQGHSLPHAVAWLPWILLSTNRAVQQPRGFGGMSLAIFTFLMIGCGAVDIAGQVLLVSGCYAIWQLIGKLWLSGSGIRPLFASVTVLIAGWGLGFVLAAGLLLPMADYLPTGTRVRHRAAGTEERPPIGIDALPLTVLPDLYGATHRGSFYIRSKLNVPESAASAYAGLIAALLFAPLAFSLGTRRWEVCFWSVFAFLGLAWSLNVAPFVQLYRLPVLNMFSFNRFVFITGWAITCLTVLGLEHLWRGNLKNRGWYILPVILLLMVGAHCLRCASSLPEPLATILEKKIRAGDALPNLATVEDLAVVKRWFVSVYVTGAVASFTALVGWSCMISKRVPSRWIFLVGSCALLVELLRYSSQSVLMCEPDLYYPRVPILEQLAHAPAGRFLGMRCLPPRVIEHYGLRDIRGYDAVDPAGIIDLLDVVRDERFPPGRYARSQWYVPRFLNSPDGSLRVPGVLNQLNLRYLVFLRAPHENMKPFLIGDGYWIWENPDVIPRTFVPRRVSNDRVGKQLLVDIGHPTFNASEHSYAEINRQYTHCRGTAQIIREHPQELIIDIDMETPGLMILSDLWYSGWEAELEGRSVPIVRANHSLRGVEVPAGHSRLVMTYRPAALKWGLRLTLAGLVIWITWGSIVFWIARRHKAFEKVALLGP